MADYTSDPDYAEWAAAHGIGGGATVAPSATPSYADDPDYAEWAAAQPKPEYSGPSLLSDPIAALTSADWWTTRPSGEKISAKQAVAGPILAALNAMTFNSGDEIVAGGNSLLDSISGNPTTYEQRLADTRDVQDNTPLAASLIAGLPAALKMPLPNVMSAERGLTPALGNIAKGASLGAGMGIAAGFGAGEGGLESRIESARDSGKVGMLTGGASTALLEALMGTANGLSRYAPNLARKSIGARQGDYAKTANDLGLMEDLGSGDLSTKTKLAIDDLLERGSLGESRDPGKMLSAINSAEENTGRKVAALVNNFDDAMAEMGGAAPLPAFENAKRYVLEGGVPADKADDFLRRIGNLETEIANKGNGKLSYLQQQKITFGKLWDPNDSIANGFNRAIYKDLQGTIESVIPDVAGLNQELSKFKVVKPILQRGVATDEASSPIGKVFQALRTSGGGGVPMLSGALLGGVPGFALGTAANAGLHLAFSPQGQATSAKMLAAAPGILNSATGAPARTALLSSLAAAQGQDRGTYTKSQTPPPKDISEKKSTYIDSLPPASTSKAIIEKRAVSKRGPNAFIDKALDKAEAKIAGKVTEDDLTSSPLKPLYDAVQAQESRGKKDAVSPKGATGLMQIMPDTGKWIAEQIGVKKYNLKDPVTNRLMGEWYLAHLMEQFDGNKELSLAAYNAGPGKVQEWIERYGKDWKAISKNLKERGAYKETVAYVPEVLARMA